MNKLMEFSIVKSEWEIVKEGPRKLTLKFGQHPVGNSREIVDMDKCCMDQCLLFCIVKS